MASLSQGFILLITYPAEMRDFQSLAPTRYSGV